MSQYYETQDNTVALYKLHEPKKDSATGLQRLEAWIAMDRSPRTDPKDKRKVISVYSHNADKGRSSEVVVFRELVS